MNEIKRSTMSRNSVCAVGGFLLVSMAACSLPPAGLQTGLDLRWMHSPSKQDRLSVGPAQATDETVTINLPAESTTIVARRPLPPRVESAIQIPRTTVRTISIRPVQEVPKKEKLLEGCEPAFSPVTAPALAHISGVCDS
jgi:hypothetical protein